MRYKLTGIECILPGTMAQRGHIKNKDDIEVLLLQSDLEDIDEENDEVFVSYQHSSSDSESDHEMQVITRASQLQNHD